MSAQIALFAAQLYLGVILQKRPKKHTFQDLLDANKGDETRPIPYIRGRWKTKPQRIWLGDFSVRAVERDSHWTDYLWAGVTAALFDTITVSYRYYVGQGFALGWGPINRVHQVYVEDLPCAVAPVVDNAGGSLLLDDPNLFGGDQPPGEGGIYASCDVIAGNYAQGRNAYLQSLEGNIPALHGIAALVIRGRSGFTESGYFSAGVINLREWQVELMAWPDVLATGNAQLPDQSYNRIHAMYEWATNADFGAEYPVTQIHLPSWRAAAQTVYDEGNGFSGEINTGGNVGEVFDQLRASVDAEVYEHPRDGLTIKLIRKDYSLPALVVLDESNTDNIDEYTPGDNSDTFNRVLLDYTDPANNYQPRPAVYEDPANRTLQRRAAAKTITYPGVSSATLAQKLVTRDGRVLSQPFPPLLATAGEVARQFWPGEVFKFEWSDPFVQKVFRVHSRTPGLSYDGEANFKLTSTEDQYSVGLSVFGTPTGTGATNPADIWATAPPSATFDEVLLPPDGLEYTLQVGISGTLESFIRGAITFGSYAGGQYARVYVTEPGGVETLSPLRLSPDITNKATFIWPAGTSGTYNFCVQTYSLTGVTNGVKVCAAIGAASFSISPSASLSPSASESPSLSPSASASPSASLSPSPSQSPSSSVSPSSSPSASASASVSPSPSVSPSSSASLSQSPSSSVSASISPSPSTSPSSSASPSAPSDPSAIANIWEWWEPSRESLSDNDPIATLTGQLSPGTGHNWTQTGSARPTYKSAILNGLGIARFDGSDDEMVSVDPTALTAVHMFVVLKMDSNTPASGKSGLFSFGNVGGSAYPLNSPNTDINCDSFRNSTEQFSKSGIDVAQWRVLEIVSTSSEWLFLLDGTQLRSTGTAFVHQSAGFIRVGRDGPFGSNWLDGDVAGMYIFSAKLTSTRADMIGYLNNRFGLSSS